MFRRLKKLILIVFFLVVLLLGGLLAMFRLAPEQLIKLALPLLPDDIEVTTGEATTTLRPLGLAMDQLTIGSAAADVSLRNVQLGVALRQVASRQQLLGISADQASVSLKPSSSQPAESSHGNQAVDLSILDVISQLNVGQIEINGLDRDPLRLSELSLGYVGAASGEFSFGLESRFGSGQLNGARQGKRLQLELASDRFDLSQIDSAVGQDDSQSPIAEQPQDIESPDSNDTEVSEEAAINWSWLTQVELDLQAKISELLLPEAEIQAFSLAVNTDADRIEITELKGRVSSEGLATNAMPWSLMGSIAPLAITTDGADATINVSVDAQGHELAVQGLANLNGLPGQELQLQLKVPDANWVSALTASDLQGLVPLQFSTNVSATTADMLKFSDLVLKTGESDFAGELSIQANPRLTVNGALRSEKIAVPLSEWSADEEASPPSADEDVGASKVKVFSAEPINWQPLRDLLGQIELTATEVLLGEASFKDLTLGLNSDGQGRLAITPFSASFGDGGIEASLTLNSPATESPDELARLDVTAKIDGVILDAFGVLPKSELEGGRLTADVELLGEGNNVAEIAGSLGGQIDVRVRDATIKNDVIELAGSDLVLELLEKLNPFIKSDPSTQLDCALLRFAADQGVFSTRGDMVIETTKMEIVGSGEIDLGEETIDLQISPTARSGVGLNAATLVKFIKLGGTLAKPAPEADAGGLLKTAVAIGAAASTGGVSVLAEGALKRVSGAGSACDRTFGEATESEPSDPPAVPDAAEAEAPTEPS